VVSIGAAKERAMLSLLALRAGSVVSMSELVEALWGENPPRSAVRAVQTYVSRVRKVLPPGVVVSMPDGYRAALGAGEVDAARFETAVATARQLAGSDSAATIEVLESALGLWRGPALADLADSPVGVMEAARLGELRRTAEEDLFEVRLAGGDHAAVVADLEAAVATEPLRERRWGQLMRALYRSGRQADALAAYQRLRHTLGDQLGIEPSATLRELERAVLEDDLAPDGPAAGAVGAGNRRDNIARTGGRSSLPSGTVTFVFSDIEGSTPLLERVGDDAYERLLGEHHRILREAIAAHAGVEVSTEGDSFFVAFENAAEAVAMALAAQVALGGFRWPDEGTVRVRMGLHTGPGRLGGDGYVGLAVHQAARVCSAAHGGQVVVSEATRNACGGQLPGGAGWLELGRHRLAGLGDPVELHQLCHPNLGDSFPPLRSLQAVAHNLPVQLSSFLGRAQELAVGAKLLAGARLLSVTGLGGTGKTRVAYQLAAEQLAQFPDGVWVAELAALSDPDLVPAGLMSALGLRDEPGQTAIETVVSYLRDRRALVVLDNCEHLIDAAAALTAALLGGCGQLRVLATSREPLRVAGEFVWTLGPLALPEFDETDLGVLAGADAVALFLERAAEARIGFALGIDNAATVKEICARLEGIPLAIELAAARVRTLPLAQIADRLERSLDLLSKGTRAVEGRQASLRATLAWSHDLLSPAEQRLFRRVAVFSGGFTLDAAEAVAVGEGLDVSEVVDALDGLVDKSLVALGDEQAGQGRYRLLETIRAYAAEHLHAAGEGPLLAGQHAEFYTKLAHDCAHLGDTPGALDRLEAEHPNLLAALQHLSEGERPVDHGQLVADLSTMWDVHGHWQLAQREFLRYLSRADRDQALEGRCSGGLGTINLRLGAYPDARDRFEYALDIAHKLGDRGSEGEWLGRLGSVAARLGDYLEGRARFQEALDIAREVGDRQFEGRWVGDLGGVAWYLGDYPEAQARFEEALAIARQLGDRVREGTWVGNLGSIAYTLGDYPEAQAQFESALAMTRELGDRHGEATWLANLGDVASNLGDYPEAQARLEEGVAIARELGDRLQEGFFVGDLGSVSYNLRDYPQALVRYEEALAIARELGDRHREGLWLGHLGEVASNLGNYPEALARYEEALAMARELGKQDSPLLDACAELLARLQCVEAAAELLAAADNINSRTHYTRDTPGQARHDATLATCRSRLDEQAFGSATERGRALEWASAVETALKMLKRAIP
jgi:predicted ATPase/class 3 adenylate cyclase/Tfp pilus assembly protein PilF